MLKIGLKKKFRAQAETEGVIVSFEYVFGGDFKDVPISETWDFYDKETNTGRKIVKWNAVKGMSIRNPYQMPPEAEIWRLEQ